MAITASWLSEAGTLANVQDLAVDAIGNVLAIINVSGGMLFEGLAAPASSGMVVMKLDPSLSVLWYNAYPAAIGTGAVSDGEFGFAIHGQASGPIDLGAGGLPAGSFLFRVDANGNHVASKVYASGGSSGAMVALPNSEYVVAGRFTSTIDFNGESATSNGQFDSYLAKLNASGSVLWHQEFGGAGFDDLSSLSVDSVGDIVVAGETGGGFELGTTMLSSSGGIDGLLAKFDASGDVVWARLFGSQADQACRAVEARADGSIVVTGDFEAEIDLGGGTLQALNQNVFLGALGP